MWDDDGKEYVDLLGGIAVNALGHAHPALVAAVTDQLATLGHISNFFASEPQIALAERLLALRSDGSAGPGRVFFTNSGAEANEAAFKLTRRTGRTHVVAAEGGFHGRTMGALALTSKEAYREPFEPLPGEVTFVPYGDVDALAAAVTDAHRGRRCSSRSRARPASVCPPDGYLAAARRIATEHGALLWLDEVQTGIGRTGRWFAHHAGRGGSAATVSRPRPGRHRDRRQGPGRRLPDRRLPRPRRRPATLFEPGNHGTTFGGNPVACAAALAVIGTIEADGLLEHVTVLGQKLRDGLAADPRVTEVRGEGLLIGLDLVTDASADVAAPALERGLHHQQPDARPDPARAAAGAHRGRRRRLPGRLAGASSTTPSGRGSGRDPSLPARRRPHPGRAGPGPRPRRRAQGRPVRTRAPSPARARSR